MEMEVCREVIDSLREMEERRGGERGAGEPGWTWLAQ